MQKYGIFWWHATDLCNKRVNKQSYLPQTNPDRQRFARLAVGYFFLAV